MPPRANWKGHMKLSLVSFAVRIHNATTSAGRVSLNQLHKDCNQRLRQKMTCPVHGDVTKEDIVKGYEFEKGRYAVVEAEEIERLTAEATKAIEIEQFIDADALEPMYLNAPYYVAPDGPVAEEAFACIREAMKKTGKIAIGRFVIAGREHIVAIQPDGKGIRMTTLRAAAEVRDSAPYFEEISDVEVADAQLELAETLIKGKIAPLDTTDFKDRYQESLMELVKAKAAGTEPVIVEQVELPQSLNFMDALKASLDEATGGKKKTKKKPPAKSVKKTSKSVKKKA